jgi:hypothetical protein
VSSSELGITEMKNLDIGTVQKEVINRFLTVSRANDQTLQIENSEVNECCEMIQKSTVRVVTEGEIQRSKMTISGQVSEGVVGEFASTGIEHSERGKRREIEEDSVGELETVFDVDLSELGKSDERNEVSVFDVSHRDVEFE